MNSEHSQIYSEGYAEGQRNSKAENPYKNSWDVLAAQAWSQGYGDAFDDSLAGFLARTNNGH